MITNLTKYKVLCILVFALTVSFILFNSNSVVHKVAASASGPLPGNSGAPGETTCTNCHIANPGAGQFLITAPASYVPGQTYQITVRHQTADTTRRRWGFQLTGLANTTPAANFTPLNGNAFVVDGLNGRRYIEHTLLGSFINQQNVASWTFNWTAPATNIGDVRLYAAGNQANNDGTENGDQIYTATANITAPVVAPTPAKFVDFDGDSKTDISIFRTNVGQWWYLRSTDNANRAFQFGTITDKIVPADYTGDGKTDIATFTPTTGFWNVLRSEDSTFFGFPFGAIGDVPVPADYDGDLKADAAVFRPSSSTWFISKSTGGTTIQQFGALGDTPTVADYDGDGKADLAIYRVALGQWWYLRSTDGTNRAFTFGTSTDKPVQGDYTGDAKADVAFFRPSTGEWFILRSEDSTFFAFPFGASGDIPSPGDYDGDGKFDAAVFRTSVSTWFLNRSTAGISIVGFGATGDVPVPSAFVP
jgi:FG-GAP-like repeat